MIKSILITNNNYCQLPCFWGFTPAEALVSDAVNFTEWLFAQEPYSYIVTKPSYQETSFYDFFYVFGNQGTLQIVFSFQDDILTRTNIKLFKPQTWLNSNIFEIDRLLATYGIPRHIYFSYQQNELPNYTIIIVYKGFFVSYNQFLPKESINSPYLFICQEDIGSYTIEAVLRVPDQILSMPREVNIFPRNSLDDYSLGYYVDLSLVTGISLEDIVIVLTREQDNCLSIPSKE